MKRYFKETLAVVVLLAVAHSAQAAYFGWHTIVSATDGTSIFTTGVTESNHTDCETKRQDAVNYYTGLRLTIVENSDCKPFLFQERFVPPDFEPELIDLRWGGPGPQCLRCEYLFEGQIEEIYPDAHEDVRVLMDQYDIGAYQEELRQLNESFDLKGFEDEMFRLELKQYSKDR